ncbi:MAG: hypothetical protein ABFD12_10150 [Syntrophorhabdus sp.]
MRIQSVIFGSLFLMFLPVIGNSQMMDMKDHDKMMKSQGMPGSGANECFKESIMRAINIQEMHMRSKGKEIPPQSDQEMMDQMKRAQTCLQSMGVPEGGRTSRNNQMQCADDWLKQAISLHQRHMRDPSSRTVASETNLSRQMREAYNCTGPARGISGE